MRKLSLALTVILPLILLVDAACFAQGTDKQAFDRQMVLALGGDAEAQYYVGMAYDSGVGVEANGDNAEKFYTLAAEQGHSGAQNSLGSGYLATGNYSEALVWYQRASQNDDLTALNSLAYMYDEGLGVAEDNELALFMYTRAADRGDGTAMWNIAILYGSGELGISDDLEACRWTHRALQAWPELYADERRYPERAMVESEMKLTPEEFAQCTAPEEDIEDSSAG